MESIIEYNQIMVKNLKQDLKIYADPEGDVMLIVDGIYQEHTTLRNDIDIVSLEITPSKVYL